MTCINVALPSLICLLFLSVTSILSICLFLSSCLILPTFFSNLACSAISAYHGGLAGSVHWQTPGKFLHSDVIKSVPFHFLWHPLKFSPPPANEGPGSFEDGDRGPLRCRAGCCCSERYGWKCVRGLEVFVHRGLCFGVGVHVHGSTYFAG